MRFIDTLKVVGFTPVKRTQKIFTQANYFLIWEHSHFYIDSL